MRKRYIWIEPRPGANRSGWVDRDELIEQGARLQIIRDHVGDFQSMADGKRYDSKSQYRRSLKEAGFIEMGNDHPTPQPYKPVDWSAAIYEQLAGRGL